MYLLFTNTINKFTQHARFGRPTGERACTLDLAPNIVHVYYKLLMFFLSSLLHLFNDAEIIYFILRFKWRKTANKKSVFPKRLMIGKMLLVNDMDRIIIIIIHNLYCFFRKIILKLIIKKD